MGPFRDGWQQSDVEAVIFGNDPSELLYVPIVISLDPPDCHSAADICIRLSSHADPTTRGNAVLGFGHLARTCGELDRSTIQPIIQAALSDSSDHVRGHAHSAVDDTSHFLGRVFPEIDAES
jgi:hypothetical protein